jgi:hypothetical protein
MTLSNWTRLTEPEPILNLVNSLLTYSQYQNHAYFDCIYQLGRLRYFTTKITFVFRQIFILFPKISAKFRATVFREISRNKIENYSK